MRMAFGRHTAARLCFVAVLLVSTFGVDLERLKDPDLRGKSCIDMKGLVNDVRNHGFNDAERPRIYLELLGITKDEVARVQKDLEKALQQYEGHNNEHMTPQQMETMFKKDFERLKGPAQLMEGVSTGEITDIEKDELLKLSKYAFVESGLYEQSMPRILLNLLRLFKDYKEPTIITAAVFKELLQSAKYNFKSVLNQGYDRSSFELCLSYLGAPDNAPKEPTKLEHQSKPKLSDFSGWCCFWQTPSEDATKAHTVAMKQYYKYERQVEDYERELRSFERKMKAFKKKDSILDRISTPSWEWYSVIEDALERLSFYRKLGPSLCEMTGGSGKGNALGTYEAWYRIMDVYILEGEQFLAAFILTVVSNFVRRSEHKLGLNPDVDSAAMCILDDIVETRGFKALRCLKSLGNVLGTLPIAESRILPYEYISGLALPSLKEDKDEHDEKDEQSVRSLSALSERLLEASRPERGVALESPPAEISL